MPRLPSKDEITVRWLIVHVPVTWWWYIGFAFVLVNSACYGVGRLSFQQLDGDIGKKIAVRDQLQSDIQQLSVQKDQLHAKLIELQVELDVKKMTPEQIEEKLKKWSRD